MATTKAVFKTPGLTDVPKNSWAKVTDTELAKRPIDRLKPGSDLHRKVLTYLLERLNFSEKNMAGFYARWQAQEKRVQAYVDLADWEQTLKDLNDSGKPAAAVSITVPYSFATIQTIVTYLIQTFAGRKPMFQIGSHKKETMEGAQMLELVLQYNADNTRLIKQLFQYLFDGQLYGLGIIRTQWKNETKKRTVWIPPEGDPTGKMQKQRIDKLVYSGNECEAIDPFMFFPDPRVPMIEVNRKGEFCFWRSYMGVHALKKNDIFTWVDAIGEMRNEPTDNEDTSARGIRIGGLSTPMEADQNTAFGGKDYVQVDQGTVEIIPAELGLGTSEKPEKWIFTLGNKMQIIQAEPFDTDHDMHPVAVIEPYSLGYGFGQPSLADFTGDIQDMLSFLVNSHMDNTKTALNNMFIVDPQMVELQDLKEPGAGKLIRLKKAAQGRSVRDVIQQLPVSDVTRGHIKDFELFMGMGDSLSAVSDNLRGQQDSGGRKTATEIRTSGEAGASRLSSLTRKISSQGMVDMTEQMVLNIQQYLEDDFYLDIVGEQGLEKHFRNLGQDGQVQVRPEFMVGDFHYPVHDGTLPMDRVAMLDVWKEIFIGVLQDPTGELRQTFSITKIFKHLADLGGAKNLDQMEVQMNVAPPGAEAGLEQQAAAGNAVPVGGSTPGVTSNPGQRLAGD